MTKVKEIPSKRVNKMYNVKTQSISYKNLYKKIMNSKTK